MPQTPKSDPVRYCKTCGAELVRKRFGKRLEDRGVFLRRTSCDRVCGNTKTEVTRDALHWRARKHLQPACQDCTSTDRLHVHHMDRNPANNDPANLRTLCASCHLKLHWREDREKRMASAAKAAATAVRRGANTRPRSTDGRFASGG